KVDVRWAEFHLAKVLAKKGATVKVVRLPQGPSGPDGEPVKVGLDDYLAKHTADEFRQLVANAIEPEDGRLEIFLSHLEDLAVQRAVEALAAGDRRRYQRGGQLVRVRRPQRPPAVRRVRPSSGLKIESVPDADLRMRLSRSARIVQIRRLKNGNKTI